MPEASLSVLVTLTSAGVDPGVVGVAAGGRGGDDRVADVPSSRVSSTPVTVTVCAMFQLAAVKVRLAGATVPSPVSLEDRAMVTSAVGWALSTTVKVAVPAASVVAARDRADGDARGVVVGVGDADVARVDPGVVGVAAGGRGGDDRVADGAVVQGVVDAGDGHGLRHVPVGGGEGQTGRRDRAFAGVARGQGDGHIRGRLGVEHDREGGGAAGLRGGGPRSCRR